MACLLPFYRHIEGVSGVLVTPKNGFFLIAKCKVQSGRDGDVDAVKRLGIRRSPLSLTKK